MTSGTTRPAVSFGVDELSAGRASGLPKSARLGLVTNNAARVASNVDVTGRAALRDAGFNLVRLFGPEHGLSAAAADGAKIADDRDPLTGLPAVSLYGEKRRPSPEELADLDAVLFDIPDVGARFYTYIWTLSHVLEACGEGGKPLYILDRPNPIGGDLTAAEGPMLDEANISTFVGRWSSPIRHSLTVGELATLWNAERKIGAELHVVKCAGWRRANHWPATGLPFVAPSPNMRDYAAALLYPGTCLVEGTNLSEGRGTDAPFRLIGAPWLDAHALADALIARRPPGIGVTPVTFKPDSRKHANEVCQGLRLSIADAAAARPVAFGLCLIATALKLHPDRFEWLKSFDRLAGRAEVREAIARDPAGVVDHLDKWTRAEGWTERVQPHLMYE
jgi:uncharacterized protein YbbC (DUF1343 family)